MAKNKKELLNETQIRKFMKLANLQPLATAQRVAELRTGKTGALGPKDGTHNPGRGRGQGEAADGSLFEADEDELEGELDATEDELGAEDEWADEEEDELEDVEGEEDIEADVEGGRMVSVDDFLSALETALEDAMGEEVEVTQDELEPEEEEEEVEDIEVEEEPGGDEEIEMEMGEEEEELMETGAKDSGASKGDKGKDADDPDARDYSRGGDRKGDEGARGGKDYVDESLNVDALVNQITARVAKRIVQEVYSKKK